MARKTKPGLSYFPHDCYFNDDLKYLIAEHSAVGYMVYFRLLEKIYKEKGYYMKSDKRTLLMYSQEINVNIEMLNAIINFCLDENNLDEPLFNKKLFYEYDIITSKGIQDRYIEAIARRKEAEFITDYLLIDTDDVNSKLKNVNIIYLNADGGTQSKVNKIKVDKSKVDKSKVKHGFKESPYFDNLNLFKKDIGEVFQKYDLKYYYDRMLVFGEKYEYENWAEAAKTWILNDEKENKAKLKPPAPQRSEPVDTSALDGAKKLWNGVMMEISKEIDEKQYLTCLDLNIIKYENNILIIKASKKDIIEKLPQKLLDKLIKKHFKGVRYSIVTKNM